MTLSPGRDDNNSMARNPTVVVRGRRQLKKLGNPLPTSALRTGADGRNNNNNKDQTRELRTRLQGIGIVSRL